MTPVWEKKLTSSCCIPTCHKETIAFCLSMFWYVLMWPALKQRSCSIMFYLSCSYFIDNWSGIVVLCGMCASVSPQSKFQAKGTAHRNLFGRSQPVMRIHPVAPQVLRPATGVGGDSQWLAWRPSSMMTQNCGFRKHICHHIRILYIMYVYTYDIHISKRISFHFPKSAETMWILHKETQSEGRREGYMSRIWEPQKFGNMSNKSENLSSLTICHLFGGLDSDTVNAEHICRQTPEICVSGPPPCESTESAQRDT